MVRDTLGNELKEGMLVMIKFNEAPALARVAQINETSVIGRSRDAMPVPGLIVFQIIVPVELTTNDLRNVWVVQQPSNQELAARQVASEVPS